MTIGSCVLMSDWQSIPFDECTDYSPFHHPSMMDDFALMEESPSQLSECYRSGNTTSNFLKSFELDSWSRLTLNSGYTKELYLGGRAKFACKSTDTCSGLCHQHSTDRKLICLQYAILVSEQGCESLANRADVYDDSYHFEYSESFLCSSAISKVSFCINIDTLQSESQQQVDIQMLQRLPPEIGPKVMNMCLEANVTSRDCYWNPLSMVTGKLCEDCQPICRSRSHSLTFVQFLLGSALLLVSIPVAWIPVAALISNLVSTSGQVG